MKNFLQDIGIWLFFAVMIILPYVFIGIGIADGDRKLIGFGVVYIFVEIFFGAFFYRPSGGSRSDSDKDERS